MKTNKFLSKLALVLLVSIITFSCKKDPEVVLKTDAAITSFKLDLTSMAAFADTTIKAAVKVEIVGEEIQINLPFGLKADTIAKLLGNNAAILEVSDKATVSPASGTPVKFNVKTAILLHSYSRRWRF